LRPKEGYFPVPPADTLQDARTSMTTTLERIGIPVEAHHHEVATGGQGEIDMRFTTLTRMADNVMIYKYVVKNVARQRGMTATFMPKPLFGDNGSGMHVHQSVWKEAKPMFAGEGYAGSSSLMLHYIAGLLRHAPALIAICAPTVNSYRRLVPGFEAPVNLAYSQRNRSAACRIPMYSSDPKAKRVEFRCPDPSCNPYLAFAAMLMAGLDGIENRMAPGEPMDKNLYDLPPEELDEVPTAPGSLEEALDALEADHQFLLKGDVFTGDVIETYIDYKRSHEVDEIRLRPHPYEFFLYYDV
jgi:glutamine synthetase